MRERLRRFSGWLTSAIVPQLRFSQEHYVDVLRERIIPGSDWLDLGCGHQMFAAWMGQQEAELAARARKLVGIDLDWAGLQKNATIRRRVFGNLEQLPFDAESFDVVTANMVVEHLSAPGLVLNEAWRVLRPNGLFIFHTPNRRCVQMTIARMIPQGLKCRLISFLESRAEEDVFPTHYRLNTLETIEREATNHGFRLRQLHALNTLPVLAMLGPVVVAELLYLRILEHDRLARFRSNIIVVLWKQPALDHRPVSLSRAETSTARELKAV